MMVRGVGGAFVSAKDVSGHIVQRNALRNEIVDAPQGCIAPYKSHKCESA